MPPALISSLDALPNAAGHVLDGLLDVRPDFLALGLLCFGVFLGLRSRALFNVLGAAYPTEGFQWRRVWGAYVAAVGMNNVSPFGGGTAAQVALTRASIRRSSWATVASAISVGALCDIAISLLLLGFALWFGITPLTDAMSRATDGSLAYLAVRPGVMAGGACALALGIGLAATFFPSRLRAIWAHLVQGLHILGDWRRYARHVCALQLVGWVFRLASCWLLLQAFHIGGSFETALVVLGIQVVSAMVPGAPGGAGVQQAALVVVLAGTAPTAALAAYAIGQQLVLVAFTVVVAVVGLLVVARGRGIGELLARVLRRACRMPALS